LEGTKNTLSSNGVGGGGNDGDGEQRGEKGEQTTLTLDELIGLPFKVWKTKKTYLSSILVEEVGLWALLKV
jgi:hypothetical protein